MKVFLSWSGERSRAIADALKAWLPSVLQAVRPYFSPEDTAKGSRWSSEIAKELEASRVALLVITPENQEAPWLLFEAGALSKNLDRSKVCPLLFGGMEPTDVKGPLVQFQAAQFSKEEMNRVLKAINSELGDLALTADVLEKVFEMWWPNLEREVEARLSSGVRNNQAARRSDRDMLEEVLSLTRNLDSKERPGPSRALPNMVAEDLLQAVVELSRIASSFELGEGDSVPVIRINRALKFMAHNGFLGPRNRVLEEGTKLRSLMDELASLREQLRRAPIEPVSIEDSTT